MRAITEEEAARRGAFPFWDGRRERMGDPVLISGRLSEALGGPGWLDPGEGEGDPSARLGRLLSATLYAFEVEDFSDLTGEGLMIMEQLRLLSEFADWSRAWFSRQAAGPATPGGEPSETSSTSTTITPEEPPC